MKRICEYCGKEFEPVNGNQKYYCHECSQQSKIKPEVEKICPCCNKKFRTTLKRKAYCSPECQIRYNSNLRRKSSKPVEYGYNFCVVCGRKFKPKYKGQKYCSEECHEVPLAKSLRRFFSLMLERFDLDTSKLPEVKNYGD